MADGPRAPTADRQGALDEARLAGRDEEDVGRSLAADRRQKAKTETKSGQGDRGDRSH